MTIHLSDNPKPSEERMALKEEEQTTLQLENLKRLCEKLDTMPAIKVDDGLSNRDHDRTLYGQ